MLIETSALLIIFATAAILIGLFYLPGIKTNINFADEGYLWHGTQEVLNGKIPIRDFRAYDPGRYYWCAFWFRLFGSSLLSLRIGLSIAQFLALSIGLTVVYSASNDWLSTLLAGLLIIAWMFPLHKQIDIMFSLLTPLMAILLVGNPIDAQYFISGVYIAVCLFFGLNHGIYAAGALSLLILIMVLNSHGLAHSEASIWFASGLLLGTLPMLSFFIFVPRLFKVYWQKKISRILKRGSANLPLPTPWLWNNNTPQLAGLDKGGQFIVKLLFTVMPIMYVAIIISSADPASNTQWYLLAIACSGLFYLHHAFSRADLGHLSQSIAPFLLCLSILLNQLPTIWLVFFMLAVITFSIKYIYLANNSLSLHLFKDHGLEKFNAAGTEFWLSPHQCHYLSQLRNLINTHSKPGDSLLLLPNLVTLYPMLQRKTAVYDIFSVYPATEEEENQMIDQLSKQPVSFALINNSQLDSREDLRFSNTHPKVWQYLNQEFILLQEEGIPDDHYSFVRKNFN